MPPLPRPKVAPKNMPKVLKPQLATLANTPPQGNEWLHEIKWDGYRIIADKKNKGCHLFTRNGLDWGGKLPLIKKELSTLSKTIVLDGEIVVLDKKGISQFQLLQDCIQKGSDHSTQICYQVFDLLYSQGKDLRKKPLLERKKQLKKIFAEWKKPHAHIFLTDYIVGKGETLFKKACQLKLEGIISKKVEGHYESKRSKSWLKNKCINRQEFVIGGFTLPKGSRKYLGALLIGYFNAKKQFIYAGKVGTGFTEGALKNLMNALLPLQQKKSPFHKINTILSQTEQNQITWINPKLLCEISFTEWTRDKILRHPAFLGVRMDKKATQVQKEEKSTLPIRITHPDKKLSTTKISKQALVKYYIKISKNILPYIKNRPLLLLRCTNGSKTCFFQKHHLKAFPKEILPLAMPGDKNPYCRVKDIKGLLYLVQFDTVEIHVGNSLFKKLHYPDRMVFDLDPGLGTDWVTLKKSALLIRDYLKKLGWVSFIKLSGKKGLHVVVPISPTEKYDAVKSCAKAIALALSEKYPELFTATLSKAKRKHKIFIDYLRNSMNATTIAPYSTRNLTKGPVSLPIGWQDLKKITASTQYSVEDLMSNNKIIAKSHAAWKGFYSCRQKITQSVLKRLLKQGE